MKDTKNISQEAFNLVQDEIRKAKSKYPADFNSTHEGFAVLKEEVDELWDDVKANAAPEKMRLEAVRVAAMAFRFIQELT
jgi:hypothetical protein